MPSRTVAEPPRATAVATPPLPCEVRLLGRMGYRQAWDLQRELVERRKQGVIPDQLLLVEHPHVITLGRNGRPENLLQSVESLARAGVEFHETNRGGDVTYHGPGQVVGYPILDLRAWRRDVVAYVRALEQVLIEALADFGIPAQRSPGATGVWVASQGELAKVAAIGVHISRWVTSHGFALNVDTDLSYFQYIIPCGLARPVTSLRRLGVDVSWHEAARAVTRRLGLVFGRQMMEPVRTAGLANKERETDP